MSTDGKAVTKMRGRKLPRVLKISGGIYEQKEEEYVAFSSFVLLTNH